MATEVTVGSSTLLPLPVHPLLLQVHARCLLCELGAATGAAAGVPARLDQVPQAWFDAVVRDGYDIVYMLGVWQTGAAGVAASKSKLAGSGTPAWAVCSSPFAITSYTVHDEYGGDDALAWFRAQLAERHIRLMLDFVPNHVACDHAWVAEEPGFVIQGSEAGAARTPADFFDVRGQHCMAHGRDPNFPAWTDTAQLNYYSPRLRSKMLDILSRISGMCDGVRCDMAMLVLPSVFQRTWPVHEVTDSGDGFTADFWSHAISEIKAERPSFVFMAEVYWDMEYDLHQRGFDYTYNKRLYDRLEANNAPGVAAHLTADMSFQLKSVQFVENHDEPRAATVFKNVQRRLAAMAISFTVPGLRFIHWGQSQGRTKFQSMHVSVRDREDADAESAHIHQSLLALLQRDCLRDGTVQRLRTTPSDDGNRTVDNIIAHVCLPPGPTPWRGHAIAIIVNYSDSDANGHVVYPPTAAHFELPRLHEGKGSGAAAKPDTCMCRLEAGSGAGERAGGGGNGGTRSGSGAGDSAGAGAGSQPGGKIGASGSDDTRMVLLRDLLSEHRYTRRWCDVTAKGLWVGLKPWQAHAFEVVPLAALL